MPSTAPLAFAQRFQEQGRRQFAASLAASAGHGGVCPGDAAVHTLAGTVGTACHYATLVGLVQFAKASAVLASTVGALVNYVLNYRWTFASKRSHDKTLPRFSLVALAGIAINALVMIALLKFVGVHYLVAQVIVTAIVLVAN